MIRAKKHLNMFRHGEKSVFHVRFRIKGREIRRSTGRFDPLEARDVAWDIYLEESGLRADRQVRRLRDTSARIGDITDLYIEKIMTRADIQQRTAQENVQTLFRMLRLVYPGKDVRELRAEVLTEDLVMSWRQRRYEREGLTYPSSNRRLNYSLNSDLRKVRSVFSRKATRLYTLLNLPDLEGFLKVSRLPQHDTRYVPIPQERIVAMDKKARDDLRPNRPGLFVTYELARFGGLRSSEILNIRRHWIVADNGYFRIGVVYRDPRTDPAGVEFKPKSRDRWVPVSKKRLDDWLSVLPKLGSYDLLVQGSTKTARKNLVEREACGWVAQFIPDRNKRLHELRKHAGSEIATRDGLMAAAQFPGDSYSVTEKHYASLLSPIKPL
jgi:hypothetical protein